MKISTNQFKNGTKLVIDNAPCSIIEHEFHKPGKGQAVMRVKYKNLLTGNTNDKTFKSGETVESADVSHKEMEFLYKDNDSWHFMDKNNYEQIEVSESQMGNASKWLKIVKAEPGVKGDTVSGATKTAKLETNVEVQVPLFVNENEIIKVDTRDMTYVGRAKSWLMKLIRK